MVEIAARSRPFERPGAVSIGRIHQRHASRKLEHRIFRQAGLHLTAENACVKSFGLGHPAHVQQEMVEAE